MDIFSIVFVCTGNRFRSPLAEAFVRRLTLGLPVAPRSYGVLNLDGCPALDEAIQLAQSCGVDLSAHRARQIGVEPLGAVDLLLGFEASHVRQAVVDAEAPPRRSFTFREFVSLLVSTPGASTPDLLAHARETVDQAARARDQESKAAVGLDMRDPFGRRWKVQRETTAEIRALTIGLVAALFGVSDTRALPEVPPNLARAKTSFWRGPFTPGAHRQRR